MDEKRKFNVNVALGVIFMDLATLLAILAPNPLTLVLEIIGVACAWRAMRYVTTAGDRIIIAILIVSGITAGFLDVKLWELLFNDMYTLQESMFWNLLGAIASGGIYKCLEKLSL